ncbi:MAG: hypothetical protein ACR5LD_01880 [Symbiopectobacterium sp.]
MLGLLVTIIGIIETFKAPSALADFSIPDYELVYNAPIETTLQAPDLYAPDSI